MKIKQWFNKRKMKKELEEKTVFKQVEDAGLNKEEILFIYDHIKKFADCTKNEIDKSEKMKDLFKSLGSLGDMVSKSFGDSDKSQDIESRIEEITKSNAEFTNKLKTEYKLLEGIVNKLQPLKEIFE